MAQRVAKLNLTATPEDVDVRITEMKAAYTEEQFAEQLKLNHMTLDDLKQNVRHSLTQNRLLNREINSQVTVSDTDITNYFNQHRSDFDLIETRYRVAEIVVTSVPRGNKDTILGIKATTDAEAKKKIQMLKMRLDAGEDFGMLAVYFSENEDTASKGGDMGFHYDSEMRSAPAALAAVAKLNVGQVTNIVPLLDSTTNKPGAYAIYKLISREPPGQRDLSDPRVQQQIRQQLRESRSDLLRAAYIEMLQDKATVKNFFAEEVFENYGKSQ